MGGLDREASGVRLRLGLGRQREGGGLTGDSESFSL